MRDVRREDGTVTAAAIHDDLRLRVGEASFKVAFQNAFAEMNGLRGVAFLPFRIFAHIEQHGVRIFGELRARLFDGDFVDARLRFLDDLEKTGRMIHAENLAARAAKVK